MPTFEHPADGIDGAPLAQSGEDQGLLGFVDSLICHVDIMRIDSNIATEIVRIYSKI